MARVVQRRTPPYLTILFAILFVFAAVMDVLFFNKYNDAQEKLTATSNLRRQLANNEQLKRPEIRQMLNNYSKSVDDRGIPSTVVSQLQTQVSTLATAVTGLPNTSFLEAQQEVDKTFTAVNPPVRRGLVKHMTDFNEQLGVKEAEITRLKAEKAQLDTQVQGLQKELADAKSDFDAKLKAKSDEIAALDQKFQNFQTEHNQKLDDAKKEFEGSAAQIKKQVTELASQLDQTQREVTVWKKKYDKLSKEKLGTPIDTDKIVRRPDGKIVRILADESLVYINIGSKDRVTEDLRLTVYPYTGIPESGAGKAVLEVVNVDENVSECRVLQQSKDDPIVPGDLVANLVFDALRTYGFVVEGAFDLAGAGEATMAGNKAIKELVRRYGGRLMKDVAIDTDYVVLGDPPSQPRKPDDTDPQDAWDLYQERLKAFTRYQEVKGQAEGMQIPRLGAQRFLDLVGYIPTKVAEAE
ncbi:MAG TPA: hypothetical protein VM695_11435 [Phycisphaerae bacterium]|nr:hypothetical protein [Phycisphaerae bacterium]